jgi:hypothetical protein
MDNAGTNHTLMQEMETKFKECNIVFDAINQQVMCYRHILNLSSGHVIKGVTSVAADEDWVGPPPPNSPDQQSYNDAIACDPITLGCNVIQVVYVSGKHSTACF